MVEFKGRKYYVSEEDVYKTLETFAPVEMTGNYKYYIPYKGERYPIKQVVSELTKIPRSEFIATDALRFLVSLNVEIKNKDY